MKIRHSLFAGAAIAAMSLPVLAHAGEVAGTVSDPREIDSEMAELMRLLAS